MSPHTLIIIPAYNEEKSIGHVLDQVLSRTSYREILVINDGSTDDTSGVVRSRNARVLDLPFNLGVGPAIQLGYMYARNYHYDYVVRIDADGQHNVSHIKELLAPILEGRADLTIGSRLPMETTFSPSLPRRVGIRMLAILVSRIVGKPISDTTSGFRANNARVTDAFAEYYPDDYPEVESIIWAHKMGFKIEEIGVRMERRMYGESSITALGSVYYMTKVILGVLVELLRKSELRQ